MNAQICEAITGRRRLRCFYNGGSRVVEPHVYGAGREGVDLLRVFQVSGHSNSGVPTGWKLFHADALSEITLTDETFPAPRAEYNSDDEVMATIYCRL